MGIVIAIHNLLCVVIHTNRSTPSLRALDFVKSNAWQSIIKNDKKSVIWQFCACGLPRRASTARNDEKNFTIKHRLPRFCYAKSRNDGVAINLVVRLIAMPEKSKKKNFALDFLILFVIVSIAKRKKATPSPLPRPKKKTLARCFFFGLGECLA
ncbi:hypothetical protein [Helicobacter sp. T3_23-1056]